jgi:hypothetical protein
MDFVTPVTILQKPESTGRAPIFGEAKTRPQQFMPGPTPVNIITVHAALPHLQPTSQPAPAAVDTHHKSPPHGARVLNLRCHTSTHACAPSTGTPSPSIHRPTAPRSSLPQSLPQSQSLPHPSPRASSRWRGRAPESARTGALRSTMPWSIHPRRATQPPRPPGSISHRRLRLQPPSTHSVRLPGGNTRLSRLGARVSGAGQAPCRVRRRPALQQVEGATSMAAG